MSALMISDNGSRLSALQLGECLTGAPHHDQMPRIPLVRRGIAGVQLDCAPEFRISAFPVPGIQVESKGREA